MLRKLSTILVTIPVAVILIVLSVANRAPVPVTLDPFNPGNPALSAQLPLFVLVLAALITGVFLGGIVTWWRQGKHRKSARAARSTVKEIRAEADALKAARKGDGPGALPSGLPLIGQN